MKTLTFDPLDPFPLIEEGVFSYAQEQAHSAQVDQYFNIPTEEVEKTLSSTPLSQPHEQMWIGLPVQSMLTPYTEIRRILEILKPRPATTIVDLGSGYGRVAWVIRRHMSDVRFIGFEIVSSRIQAGLDAFLRHGESLTTIEMHCADLADPALIIPSAEYYFIYDFGSRRSIEKVLNDLRLIASKKKLTVVARGRLSRDLIEKQTPWLSQVHSPRHFAHYSIYRSA